MTEASLPTWPNPVAIGMFSIRNDRRWQSPQVIDVAGTAPTHQDQGGWVGNALRRYAGLRDQQGGDGPLPGDRLVLTSEIAIASQHEAQCFDVVVAGLTAARSEMDHWQRQAEPARFFID